MRPRLVLSALAVSASILFTPADAAERIGEKCRDGNPLETGARDEAREPSSMWSASREGENCTSDELLCSGTDDELMAVARGLLRMQSSEVEYLDDWLADTDNA